MGSARHRSDGPTVIAGFLWPADAQKGAVFEFGIALIEEHLPDEAELDAGDSAADLQAVELAVVRSRGHRSTAWSRLAISSTSSTLSDNRGHIRVTSTPDSLGLSNI